MFSLVKENRQVLVGSLLAATMLLAAFYWQNRAGEWFVDTSRDAGFVLTELNISGLGRTSEPNVLAVLDIDNGMPLLAINLPALQSRIEALPWVKQASIVRTLPGTLDIHVTERVPYALQQVAGKVFLIDVDGVRITDRELMRFSELPLIVGETGEQDLASFEQLRIQAPELSNRIKSAIRVSGQRWDIVFDNGVRVKLPDDASRTYAAANAWTKFIELEAQHRLLAREVSVIDMRMEGRLIVRVTPEGRRQMAGKEWVL